ncbi:DUF4254 domain-containing protein [Streptomyces sp. NPDC029216]|uniref:DUF4254 domain-containing protein n=1 Tax=Streptomyces sp. NPDC029216 TaxID=3154701 RepID=UPI0034038D36
MTDSLHEHGTMGAGASRLRALLSSALEDAARHAPGAAGRILGELLNAAEALLRQNREQWKLEDVSHDPATGMAQLARTKQMIDRSNAIRTSQINRIDQLAQQLQLDRPSSGGSPSLHLSETVGELTDRICILLLKEEYAADREARDFAGRKSRHLARSLELTVTAMVRGQAALPPRGIMKFYGPAEERPA